MSQKTILHLFFLLFPILSFSQNDGKTSATAYEIFSKGALSFNFENVIEKEKEKEAIPCLEEYKNIFWIEWTIMKAGYLSFTIFPTYDNWGDVDFAIFKVEHNRSRKKKKLLRCMNSGENLTGDDNTVSSSSFPCMGVMGLSIAESPSQIIEYAGCDEGDNNFLSALQCKKGETYLLAIAQYDNPKANYSLELCGSAQLMNDIVSCEEYTKKKWHLPNKKIISFFEKKYDDNLSLFIQGFEPQTVKVYIEKEGNVVQEKYIDLKEDQGYYELPIKELPKGKYQLKLELKKIKQEGFFVKK